LFDKIQAAHFKRMPADSFVLDSFEKTYSPLGGLEQRLNRPSSRIVDLPLVHLKLGEVLYDNSHACAPFSAVIPIMQIIGHYVNIDPANMGGTILYRSSGGAELSHCSWR